MEIPAPDRSISSLLNPDLNKQPLPATPTQPETTTPDLNKIPLPPSGRSSSFVSIDNQPQQEFKTETGEQRAFYDDLVPRLQGDINPDTHNYRSTMGESIKRAVIDDGLTSNLVRWIDQQHASIADPDPAQAHAIREAMPELIVGLAPSDVEYLQSLPTLELAEREAERLRQQYWWQQATEDDGFLKGLVSGIGGFLLDPLNLVPGAMLLKGSALTTKASMAVGRTGGGLSLAKGSIGSNVAKWGAFGISEEIIRAYPRLQADPNFREREYWESIMYAGGFGAAIPALPILGKAAGSAGRRGAIELENAYKNIANSSAGVSLAQNLRTANNVLADLDTSSAKAFRQQDKGQLWQNKKEATIKKSNENLDGLNNSSVKARKKEARQAFEDGQYQRMSDDTVEQAAESLIRAGHLTKESAEKIIGVTGDVVKVGAKVGQKIVESPAVQAAAKKLAEGVKREATTAAKATVNVLKNTDEYLKSAAFHTIQGVQSAGPIAKDIGRVLKKVATHQSDLDKASSAIDPEVRRQQTARIKEKTDAVEKAVKDAQKKPELKTDFKPDDIAGPNTVKSPDPRGPIKSAIDDLENTVDSFGADTAGAARVQRSFWEKRREDARDAKEAAVYEARQAIEDLRIKRDEFLDQLPEATPAEARKNIQYLFDSKISALDGVASHKADMNGVRPAHRPVTTVNEQVGGTYTKGMFDAQRMIKQSTDQLLKDMPNLKHTDLQARVQGALDSAIVRGSTDKRKKPRYEPFTPTSGTTQTDINTMFDAVQSPTQRAKAFNKMGDEFETNWAQLREDLSLEDIATSELDYMFDMMDHVGDHIGGMFDMMQNQALSPLENTLRVGDVHQAMSNDFEASGWQPLLEEQFVNNKRNKAIANQAGGLTHSLQSQVLGSGVPLQQNLGLRLFETSAGFGGDRIAPTNTAAIVAQNLHNQVHVPYLRAYDDFQKAWAKEQNWSWLQEKKNYKGHSEGYADIAHMNETLMIAQNQRRLGKPQFHGPAGKESPAILKMLDEMDAAYAKIHEIQMESGIEGVRADNQIKHHQKQVWNDEKLLQMSGLPGGREATVELFQKGLEGGGMKSADAYEAAIAFFDSKHSSLHAPRLGGNQKLTNQTVNGAMPSILEVTEQMRKNGVDEQGISRVTAAINEAVGEIDGPGYLNHQMKVDYEASVMWNGKEVRIVDLLDLDTAGHLERQSKESTALVAINDAFDGNMNSYQAIEDYLVSSANQAQAMGGKNLSREIRNGISMMTGREYDGQLPQRLRMVRGHLQLTSMGGLMESQLAEAGLSITRGSASMAAMKQVKDANRGSRRVRQGRDINTLPPAIAENKELLDELQAITGNFSDMYSIQRNNVVFDAEDLGQSGQLQGLDRALDTVTGGKYRPAMHSMQQNLTGFGKIRALEDQVAGMSVLNDMARLFINPKTGEFRPPGEGASTTSVARWRDMGLDTGEQSTIRKLFDSFEGHIRVDENTGNITRLNIEDWTPAQKREMGVILERNASRQIQKGYVGESSPTLMNPMWAFLTQFRSYTMIAAEKQQVRNLKFADKEMATGMVLNAATSAISRMIRIHSLALSKPMDDREEYRAHKMESIGYETMKYMAMAAMVPELSGVINQLVGQPFGAHPAGEVRGGEDLIPALSYFQRLMQAQQDGIPTSDAERGRLQSLIQLGTIKQANFLFGLLRTALDD